MNNPYKIECWSTTGVKIVSGIIDASEGHFVVEGLAIVTDYSFNELQTHMCIACISKVIPNEDLTIFDLECFAEALK